jgi:radical SAM protein with 4Fe4S-binding SPASM domain
MCGQWSEEGYIQNHKEHLQQEMEISVWKRLIDELVENKVYSLLLRGGEVFLHPGIIELLEYIHSKGLYTSIDTNGTCLEKYLKDIVRIGKIHLTFSIDGPEEVHDYVREIKGSFKKLKENILSLNELEKESPNQISKSIAFTISPYSIKGLGDMPEIARSLGIDSITLVPYYYITNQMGKEYEKALKDDFNVQAYSWHGFHHEDSGIDFDVFKNEYLKFMDNLKEIKNFPYMGSGRNGFSLEDYRLWFHDTAALAGTFKCMNVEKFIDIQPNGNVNFCTDFPDAVIGNALENSIREIWNGEKAKKFRDYRREKLLPVCIRCGAKYMSEVGDKL